MTRHLMPTHDAREIGTEALANDLLNITDDNDLVMQESHMQGALMMHGRQLFIPGCHCFGRG